MRLPLVPTILSAAALVLGTALAAPAARAEVTPPTFAPQAPTPVSGQLPTRTYAVVKILNKSGARLVYQVRWSPDHDWSKTIELAPGASYRHWSSTGRAPQLRIDESTAPGHQTKIYRLEYATQYVHDEGEGFPDPSIPGKPYKLEVKVGLFHVTPNGTFPIFHLFEGK